jgi:hypothetical protein
MIVCIQKQEGNCLSSTVNSTARFLRQNDDTIMASTRRNYHKISIVWLDIMRSMSNIDHETHQNLQDVGESLKIFHESNACVNYLFHINDLDVSVVLILSNGDIELIVPFIDALPHLYRIYVYASKGSLAKHSRTNNHAKVYGTVFQDIKSTVDHLKVDLKIYQNEFVAVSFITDDEMNVGNRNDPSFLYNQLLKDILLKDFEQDKDELARAEMLAYLRQTLSNRSTSSQLIDEFDRQFSPERAIYWYTRDCFLYQILNNALWTPKPIVLYKLRYFIRHLHQQIISVAANQPKLPVSTMIYRGQRMKMNEFNIFNKGTGGLLSFNNFLSTSLDQNVAKLFATVSKGMTDEISIIFEMDIQGGKQIYPYIRVGELGFFNDKEQEILFSLGTVFRIDKIKKLDENHYAINLSVNHESDEALKKYIEKLRRKTRSTHPLTSLIKLMDEMGQYNMLDDLAELFKKDEFMLTDEIASAGLQHALGSAYLSAGKSDTALAILHETLHLYLKHLPENHSSLSPTYNNIGSAYHAMQKHAEALTYQKKALESQLNAPNPDLDSIATYSMNIGAIHRGLGEYDEALIHMNKALKLRKKELGEQHPLLSEIYNGMARVYDKKQEHDKAG